MQNDEKAEQEIRDLLATWRAALEAKDLDGLTADYAANAVLYDAIPPYKAEGVEAIRTAWECCLPYLPDFKSVHRDLVIHATNDMAVVHGLHSFETEGSHPCSESWVRISVCYRRIRGDWKVVHEHASMPFNPMNSQIWPIRDPGKLDSPDYSAGTDES